MGVCCELIKTKRVLCDEIFHTFIDETALLEKGGCNFPSQTPTGDVSVTVVKCELSEDYTRVFVTFLVQEELYVNAVCPQPVGEESVKFEYAFYVERIFEFQKCDLLTPVGCPESQPKGEKQCQVFNLEITPYIQVLDDPVNTLQNLIQVEVKIKVDEEIQTIVSLCPPANSAKVDL